MSRRARVVIPNVPHHVTQRGGRKQDVFFLPDDRQFYLHLLRENGQRYGVEFISYTLMTNHVHHLVVPLERDSLRWTFQMTHKRYADYINARSKWTGHLWQQRYYSSPLDREYIWVAIRYILRNPVEAGLARHPLEYQWSSAKANSGIGKDSLLTVQSKWCHFLNSRSDWSSWLNLTEDSEKVKILRKRTTQDLPTGSEDFLLQLEREHQIKAHPPKLGRPQKVGKS